MVTRRQFFGYSGVGGATAAVVMGWRARPKTESIGELEQRLAKLVM